MDSLIDDVTTISRRCERAANKFQNATKNILQRIENAAHDIGKSWSGSWIGYQACVYYGSFEVPPPGVHFDYQRGTGEGFDPFFKVPEKWRDYRYETVVEAILERAGWPDLEELSVCISDAHNSFEESQDELSATLSASLAKTEDERLRALLASVTDLRSYSKEEFVRVAGAKRSITLTDSETMAQGIRTPPHIAMEALAHAASSEEVALKNLGKLARQTKLYLEKRLNMTGKGIGRTEGKVFIGHGRSPAWRDLKDLLSDRLGLEPDEFDLESAAGLTTKERLEEMLDTAVFAFIVMTAEDQHADETRHARENVIHEAGLFQGRLGFRRAIILLEEGCAEFSNIEGLVQIRFPLGNILSISEKIRQVLEREDLL